jgi:thymidylate kinase
MRIVHTPPRMPEANICAGQHTAHRGHALTVELFGPPGAGKTRFCGALTEAIHQHGMAVSAVCSTRPSELEHPPARLAWSFIRAGKFFQELRTAGRAPGAQILDILPPQNPVWRFRFAQYLARLADAYSVSAGSQISLIDQGYLTGIASLAALSGLGCELAERAMLRALAVVPRADVVVHLRTSPAVLDRRLAERRSHQLMIERLLEITRDTDLRQRDATESLLRLILERREPVIEINNDDEADLRTSVQQVAAAIDDILRRTRGYKIFLQKQQGVS